MLIPVRCWTCGLVVGNLFEPWMEKLEQGKDPKEILDEFGLKRVCCRRMLITHVELLDETIKFSLSTNKFQTLSEQ